MTKLKEWFKDSANAIIVLVFAIGAAIIYALEKRLGKANYRLGKYESDAKLGEVLVKKDQAAKEADDAEKEYNRIRNEYISNKPDGNGPGSKT